MRYLQANAELWLIYGPLVGQALLITLPVALVLYALLTRLWR